MSEQESNDNITPLDKEWWRQFAQSFMEEGETAKQGATDASEELSKKFDDVVEKARSKFEALVASSRSEAEASFNSALKDISERLDRIEGHLEKKSQDNH